MPERTLPQLFEDAVRKFGPNVYLWEKRTDKYEPTTYAEFQPFVHAMAAGLLSLGLGKGDRVALIADARNNWIMSELGILYTGAVNVPISVKVEERTDLKFRLAHSECRMAIISQSQVAKVREVKKDLARLEKIIVLDPLPAYDPDEVYVEEILARGREFLKTRRAEFEAAWTGVRESDYANICYTSGTTADPKGIILTHRNYTANIEQANSLIDCPPSFRTLLILPWDHAFGHTCGIYTMMKNGASLGAIQQGKTALETLRNFPVNMKEIKPTIMLSAPALAKNLQKGIERGIKEKGPKIEALFKKALALAYDYNGLGFDRGAGAKKLKKPLYALYDRILFRKVREAFGGELEYFVGGAALLDLEIQKFFYAIGVPMYQGYGLTEASPIISANGPKAHKMGSSGKPAGNMEIEIRDAAGKALPVGETGEIAVKGENVMVGYWKNERATKEVLRDGWLHTGDLGYLDTDGFLFVLGRVKSLLIANDGEKYSPEVIEETIVEHSPYIDQMMLYNNQSPFTVALVVPAKEAIVRRLKETGLSTATPEGQTAALKIIDAEIASYRAGGTNEGMFPGRWMPAAVSVLGEPFSEANGCFNFLGKLVRSKVNALYADRIEYMFTPEGKDIANPRNLTIVGRF
jgi:long-chain acyl-CoA synthetase